MAPFPGALGSTTIQPALCSLGPGDSAYVFGHLPPETGAANSGQALDDSNVLAEEPIAPLPYASGSVCFSIKGGGAPPMVCIEIAFKEITTGVQSPSAPGSFEVDVQEADTNSDDAFILPTATVYTINSVNASSQRARVDLSPTGGKFMRLSLKTLTNDVEIIAKITRLA